MFYLITLALILLGLIYEKSKLVRFFQLLNIWILLGWSSGNADYNNYLTRYTYYNSLALTSRTEFLFAQMFKISNKLGLTYPQFLIIVSLIYVLILGFVVSLFSSNPNFVLALYMIYPACMEATQIRFTIASGIVLLGFLLLLNENIKLGEFYYVLCVICAALIHIGMLFFLVMLPIRRLDKKKSMYYSAIIIAGVVVFRMGAIRIILSLFPGMMNKLTFMHLYETRTMVYWFFIQLVLWITFILLLRYFGNFTGNGNQVLSVEKAMKIAIISAIALPVTFIFRDIYRVQQTLSILYFCALTNVYDEGVIEARSQKIIATSNNRIFLMTLCLVVTFICLFVVVLASSNFENVFLPYFENNTLFGSQ